METTEDSRNDGYLDALVQMGVLRVTQKKGEEWITFRESPSGLIDRAMELGLLRGDEEQEYPLISIAAAMSVTLLHDRGIPFSESDLVGVASVLNGVFLSSLEGTHPVTGASRSRVVYARNKALTHGRK